MPQFGAADDLGGFPGGAVYHFPQGHAQGEEFGHGYGHDGVSAHEAGLVQVGADGIGGKPWAMAGMAMRNQKEPLPCPVSKKFPRSRAART